MRLELGMRVEGEERKVRHRSLVTAVCRLCDKRKKQHKRQREEGSAALKVICL